jgi:hypothetical protein
VITRREYKGGLYLDLDFYIFYFHLVDKNPGDQEAHKKFTEVAKAYEVSQYMLKNSMATCP